MSGGDDLTREIAALNHAREMLALFADLRARNINFFIVFVGVLVAAYVNTSLEWLRTVICAAGAVISGLFWLFDRRTFVLIRDARRDLERLQKHFPLSLHTVDSYGDDTRPSARSRLWSYTALYRILFAATLGLSLLGLIKAPSLTKAARHDDHCVHAAPTVVAFPGIVISPVPSPSPPTAEAVVVRIVNLRRSPSTEEPTVRLLSPPDRLRLLESTTTNRFLHVRTERDEEGWVWSGYVQIVLRDRDSQQPRTR